MTRVPFRLTAAAGAFFMLAACATPALAQPAPQPCDARDRVLAHLATKYREVPVGVGITNRGGMLEVLTTADGGTWTIIVTLPNGISCMVASGEGWRTLKWFLEKPAA